MALFAGLMFGAAPFAVLFRGFLFDIHGRCFCLSLGETERPAQMKPSAVNPTTPVALSS
jgi:hypothetical protein